MPVVSPVSADDKGTLLNINADTVAAGIGAALKAEKLMLVTGAPGILESLEDPRSIISYTDLAGLKKLKDTGQPERRHVAEGEGHRRSDPRRRAPRARDFVQERRTASSPKCSPTKAPARWSSRTSAR